MRVTVGLRLRTCDEAESEAAELPGGEVGLGGDRSDPELLKAAMRLMARSSAEAGLPTSSAIPRGCSSRGRRSSASALPGTAREALEIESTGTSGVALVLLGERLLDLNEPGGDEAVLVGGDLGAV